MLKAVKKYLLEAELEKLLPKLKEDFKRVEPFKAAELEPSFAVQSRKRRSEGGRFYSCF